MRRTIAITAPAVLALYALYPAGPETCNGTTAASPLRTESATSAKVRDMLATDALFVPNLGQWNHSARFVHRAGRMTVFIDEQGWVLDVAESKTRGVAVGMTFEGRLSLEDIVGEKRIAGRHNYFLGDDARRWRTHVPLYTSVRYRSLYPGIDVRLRHANRVPEYDLLLQPGANLSLVRVRVDGAQGLSIADDGSLIIKTERGSLTQPRPKTWEIGRDGERRPVNCSFTLLGADRFGFVAPGWNGETSLTIDPSLIWSTFLGGSSYEYANGIAVDASGAVTLTGHTFAPNYPTTAGAYDVSHGGSDDVVVSRLDPSAQSTSSLVYSTFIGGSREDRGRAVSVDDGVITVTGYAMSANFPATAGAFDTSYARSEDGFVIRLDPSKSGSAQLTYATFLGGNSGDIATGLHVDSMGIVTVQGRTFSSDFPTTANAYDSSKADWDVFVSRLDPSKSGSAQLVYSTLLGGKLHEWSGGLAVDAQGVITVSGFTDSIDYPTTSGAFDTTFGGVRTVWVSQLDPGKSGAAQLIYSTFLGDTGDDRATGVSIDNGILTVAGYTQSTGFPTTNGAYDTSHNGDFDAFVSQLDPSKTGAAQLVYSTFLGATSDDRANAMAVTAGGIVTVTGETFSGGFPTTIDAFDRSKSNSADAFAARLDPSKTGTAQLVYSTFLGGKSTDDAHAVAVDASGTAIITGGTQSGDLPATAGAYDTSFNGSRDIFVSRLRMDSTFYADRHELSLKQAGTQNLWLEAGAAHANQKYAIFGSASGTSPGVNLGIHIPLNIDAYTLITIAAAVPPIFRDFGGTLDGQGAARASFNVPANLPSVSGITLYHAFVVIDGAGNFRMASNAVPLRLR